MNENSSVLLYAVCVYVYQDKLCQEIAKIHEGRIYCKTVVLHCISFSYVCYLRMTANVRVGNVHSVT